MKWAMVNDAKPDPFRLQRVRFFNQHGLKLHRTVCPRPSVAIGCWPGRGTIIHEVKFTALGVGGICAALLTIGYVVMAPTAVQHAAALWGWG